MVLCVLTVSITTPAIAIATIKVLTAVKVPILPQSIPCNVHLYREFCLHTLALLVKKPPMIIQPPANTVTRLGDPVHLSCIAEGHPAPTYQWYKDGVLIPDEIESVLYIPDPSPEDRGNYTCKAINSEGETDETRPAKLDITGILR